jgi:hypothetical protein
LVAGLKGSDEAEPSHGHVAVIVEANWPTGSTPRLFGTPWRSRQQGENDQLGMNKKDRDKVIYAAA